MSTDSAFAKRIAQSILDYPSRTQVGLFNVQTTAGWTYLQHASTGLLFKYRYVLVADACEAAAKMRPSDQELRTQYVVHESQCQSVNAMRRVI